MQEHTYPAPIVVTMGCPSGVGPEIAVVAVREARRRGIDCRLLGDRGALEHAAQVFGLDPTRLLGPSNTDAPLAEWIPMLETVAPLDPADRMPGKPTAVGGRAQLSWIDRATDMANRKEAAAIVTGPVSKEVIAHCGADGAAAFTGHTEHIARRLGTGVPVMTFVADGFAVALVTTHLPVRDVASALTVEGVRHATVACVKLLLQMGKRPARLVVSALNPHAGEGGMLGHEEQTTIAPAIEQARRSIVEEGLEAIIDGPTPAEAAFRVAMNGAYDGVVAMYHDQGTIPMKLKFFGRAVNVTAGLPILRTSVDHGTAYDIAGTGKADAGSLLEAIRLADRLARG
jgi:4-hydroxythreonine-4-phosphate dehydrogenase